MDRSVPDPPHGAMPQNVFTRDGKVRSYDRSTAAHPEVRITITTDFAMGSYPSPPPEEQAYRLADIPGKGKGLLATTSLAPGTLLISEAPLFTTESLTNASTIESDLGKLVRSLPKDSQRAFLSLHNNNPGPEPFSNIIRSNGYPLGP
ncbi:hypothetical protein LTR17_025613 [Elasticomyces elasticus]|nr:hypothetical protein LTR17_025613 [Elasticomyces elasticus]